MAKDARGKTPAAMRARAKQVRELMRKIVSKSDHDQLREYVEDLELRAAEAELKHAPGEPVLSGWWRP